MQLKAQGFHEIGGPGDVGAIVIFPPRDVADDELRLARLEQYLDAEFPGRRFLLSDKPSESRERAAVGILKKAAEAAVPTPPDEMALIGQVLDAVTLFLDYGQRPH